MTAPLNPRDALKALDSDTYFIVARQGREALLSPTEVLNVLKRLAEMPDVKTLVDDAKRALGDQLATLKRDVQSKPTATTASLGIVGLVGATIASACTHPDERGLVRAGDVVRYVAGQDFVTRGQLFPADAVVLGPGAGVGMTHCENVVLGTKAGRGGLLTTTDAVVLGAKALALHDHSVSLGNSAAQVHVVKGVATRADARDFVAEPLDLGLDFLLRLKPVRAKADRREDYIDFDALPPVPVPTRPAPPAPELSDDDPSFHEAQQAYFQAVIDWKHENEGYPQAMRAWQQLYRAWVKAHAPGDQRGDGSHASEEEQLLLFADDLLHAAGIEQSSFPGVVDMKARGGLDIKAVRHEELIPVLVKGLQDLHAYVRSEAFTDRVASTLLRNMQFTKRTRSSGSDS